MNDLKLKIEAAVMARGGKQQGSEIRFQCPCHDDSHASADYNPGKAVWICRACGESGNYWHLGLLLGVISNGHRADGYKETRRWDVGPATHKRLEKAGQHKRVLWERGGHETLDGLPTADLPLYAVELLTDADADLLVSEGEKPTDALLALGFAAVGTVTGAAGTLSIESLKTLAAHAGRVFLCQDNDQPGRSHMTRIASRLLRMGQRTYIVDWPEVPEKGDSYDYVAAGHTADDVQAVLDAAPPYDGEAEAEPEQVLPEISTTDRHLRDKTADALSALYQGNNPPHIFRRSGALTRISVDEKGRPFTETLTEAALRGKLARAANFIRISEKGESHAVTPPLDVTRDIESLGSWDFPPLGGITEAPVLRRDGTVLMQPGYDLATNLYYVSAPGLVVPPIQEAPNGELKAAIELVIEVLCDFPFDGEASRANGYGALISPVMRPAVDGPAPLPTIDKPQPGSGASLMADVISIVTTGHLAATMGVPQSEEEWEKKLSSHLLAGRPLCVIDNIEGKLYSDTLSRYLTSTQVSIRPLGRSADIILTNNMSFMATGNNIRLGGDMPRRCYWIRLDAGVARPWLRDIIKFKHSDLREWVSTNRGAILAAILTIARAWVIAGRPAPDGLPMLGGFESYCRTIGGVLAFMGISGFLDNLFSMYDKMDADTPQWEGFLDMWREVIGDAPVTVAELIKRLNGNDDLVATLPDNLATRDGRDYSRRLGNTFAKRADVRLPNGLMLTKGPERKHAKTWAVVSYQNANSPNFSYKSELGELADTPAHKSLSNIFSYKSGVEINSLNSPLGIKSGELTHPDTPNDADPWAGMPDFPTDPCGVCGGIEYGADFKNKRFVCENCHPKPEEE